MTESRLPHRRFSAAPQRLAAERRTNRSESQLRRVAECEPRAVLGVVAFWLGSDFSEGANHVHA